MKSTMPFSNKEVILLDTIEKAAADNILFNHGDCEAAHRATVDREIAEKELGKLAIAAHKAGDEEHFKLLYNEMQARIKRGKKFGEEHETAAGQYVRRELSYQPLGNHSIVLGMQECEDEQQREVTEEKTRSEVYIDREGIKYRVMQVTSENSWIREDLSGKEGRSYIVCKYNSDYPFEEAKPRFSYARAQQDLEEFAAKYGWKSYEETVFDEWFYTYLTTPYFPEQAYQIAINAEVDIAMKDEVAEGLQALRTASIRLKYGCFEEFKKANQHISYLADKAFDMGNHDLGIKILKTATQIINEERNTIYVVEIGTKAEGFKIISNFNRENKAVAFIKTEARKAKNDLDYCKVSKSVGDKWQTLYDFNQKSKVAQFMILTGKRPGGITRRAA